MALVSLSRSTFMVPREILVMKSTWRSINVLVLVLKYQLVKISLCRDHKGPA